ncbi:MAG: hypothetical protein ACP5O4_05975 [bacterium]
MFFPSNIFQTKGVIARLIDPIISNFPLDRPNRFPLYNLLIGKKRAETRIADNNKIILKRNEIRPYDSIKFNPPQKDLIQLLNSPQPIKPNIETSAKDYDVFYYSYQITLTRDDVINSEIQFNYLNNENEYKQILAERLVDIIDGQVRAFSEGFYNEIERMLYEGLTTGQITINLQDGGTATWDFTFFGNPLVYTVSTLWTSTSANPILDLQQAISRYVNIPVYERGLGGKYKGFAIIMPTNIMNTFKNHPSVLEYLKTNEFSAFQGDINEIIDNKEFYLKPRYYLPSYNTFIYEYITKKVNNDGTLTDLYSSTDRILIFPLDVDLVKLYTPNILGFEINTGKVVSIDKDLTRTSNNLVRYDILPIKVGETVAAGYVIRLIGGIVIAHRAPEVVQFVKVV